MRCAYQLRQENGGPCLAAANLSTGRLKSDITTPGGHAPLRDPALAPCEAGEAGRSVEEKTVQREPMLPALNEELFPTATAGT